MLPGPPIRGGQLFERLRVAIADELTVGLLSTGSDVFKAVQIS